MKALIVVPQITFQIEIRFDFQQYFKNNNDRLKSQLRNQKNYQSENSVTPTAK